jgi:putative DNA primase/helicase
MTSIESTAARLNLHRAGREWRGSCPACGYGSDAFSLSAGRNGRLIGWCASCRDKDAIRSALGADAPPSRTDAARAASEAAEDRAKKQQQAISLWDSGEVLTGDCPASKYLRSRCLESAIGNLALRYRADTRHPVSGRHPALLCRIDDVAGNQVGVHRIFVTTDGYKANVTPPKAAKGTVWSGAIRFGTGPEIVVAEGAETALAAGLILGLPAWSAISAGNLQKGLALPPEVQSVAIAADHDKPGIDAAQDAARRWRREGRTVRLVLPDGEGRDFADLLRVGEVA